MNTATFADQETWFQLIGTPFMHTADGFAEGFMWRRYGCLYYSQPVEFLLCTIFLTHFNVNHVLRGNPEVVDNMTLCLNPCVSLDAILPILPSTFLFLERCFWGSFFVGCKGKMSLVYCTRCCVLSNKRMIFFGGRTVQWYFSWLDIYFSLQLLRSEKRCCDVVLDFIWTCQHIHLSGLLA